MSKETKNYGSTIMIKADKETARKVRIMAAIKGVPIRELLGKILKDAIKEWDLKYSVGGVIDE